MSLLPYNSILDVQQYKSSFFGIPLHGCGDLILVQDKAK